MSRSTSPRSRRAAASLATLLGLAACGDDEGGPTTGAGGGGGDATTATASTSGSASTGDGGGASTAQSGSGGGGPTSSASSTGSGGEAPELAELHVVGRTELGEGDTHTFTWSATGFRARVDGAAPEVQLDGASGVWFQIVIDGTPTSTFETFGGPFTYPLAAGLSAGPHDVEIVRRNEGFFGDVTFAGFGGGPLVPSPVRGRRLLFVGDSLTAGYGVEGTDPCNFSGATESAFDAYAAVAARAVGADAHVIAYSGKGVVQNYGGDTNELMPELWTRTLTNDPASSWDFGRFAPHAVVVNLGTNDFSAPIDDGAFVAGYAAFLGEIRARHAAAPIVAVTWAHWGQSREALVAEAVAATGDEATSTTRFTILGEEGLGCDGHTNLVTNARLGAELATTLRDLLGW